MSSRGLYKSRTLQQLTGFSPALLRAWESRHRLLEPKRSEGGNRMYTEADLQVLLRVREMLGQGRSIGEIAALGRKALLAQAPAPTPAPAGPRPSPAPPLSVVSPAPSYLRAAVDAMGKLVWRLDRDQLLELMVGVLVDDFEAALARVWLHDAPSESLVLLASNGLSRRLDGSRARIDLRTYPFMVGRVARTREAFVRNGLLGDPMFEQDWVQRERLMSVAILPLVDGPGLLGVLAAFFRHPMTTETGEVLGTFATLASRRLAGGGVQPSARPSPVPDP